MTGWQHALWLLKWQVWTLSSVSAFLVSDEDVSGPAIICDDCQKPSPMGNALESINQLCYECARQPQCCIKNCMMALIQERAQSGQNSVFLQHGNTLLDALLYLVMK